MRLTWSQALLWLLCGLLSLGSRAEALRVAQQENRLFIDGISTALTFARGCTDPAEVSAYKAMGFNTLLVRVESPGTLALESAETLIAAAEAQDLYVLIELANGDWAAGSYACPTDAAYLDTAASFVSEVVPRLATSTRLVGWIISTVDEPRMITGLGTFSQFLQDRYTTIEELNSAWTPPDDDSGRKRISRVPSFRGITEKNAYTLTTVRSEAVAGLVNEDIAAYRALVEQRNTDFQSYLRTRYANLGELNQRWEAKYERWEAISTTGILQRDMQAPGETPLAMLELARYRAELPRRLMDWWAKEIANADTEHLLFAGGQISYRLLSMLPPSVNGAFVECYPGLAEADPAAHNPHAIDIARHGNRYIALAGVSAQTPDPAQFGEYLYTAALHGAAGIGVADWPLVRAGASTTVLHDALEDLRTRALLNRTPAPTVAAVYVPYAAGMMTSQRPLYGYLPDDVSDGPGLLFFALRQGTCYGQMDYLNPIDLADLPLSRYRVLLLPSAYDLPVEAMAALEQFVGNGGIVLADLGAGTLQATGNHVALPPALMSLFRVRTHDMVVKESRDNLEAYRLHPLFPRVLSGTRSTGLLQGFAVKYSARVLPMEGADLLFKLVPTRAPQTPVARPYAPLPRVPTRGVFIAHYGNGYAIYASLPLYRYWVPGTQLFEEFHRDLFAQGADMQFEVPVDFLPTRAALAGYADGSLALWAKDSLALVTRLRNPDRQLFAVDEGWCELLAEETKLHSGRGHYRIAQALPVRVDPTEATVYAAAVQADAGGIVMELWTDEATAGREVTLRLTDGQYRVTADSPHRVSVFINGQSTVQTVRADALGEVAVTLPLTAQHATVAVTGAVTVLEMDPEDADDETEGPTEVLIHAVPFAPDIQPVWQDAPKP